MKAEGDARPGCPKEEEDDDGVGVGEDKEELLRPRGGPPRWLLRPGSEGADAGREDEFDPVLGFLIRFIFIILFLRLLFRSLGKVS